MLARSWLRGVVRASSVGLLVPAGLLLALAVTATIGGAGGLRGADQLFSGPRMPPAAQQALTGPDRTPLEGDVPVIPEASRIAVTQRRTGTEDAVLRRLQARSRARRREADRRRPERRPPAREPAAGAPPQSQPPAQQPPPQQPPPEKPPGPIRQVGGVVTGTVRPLPVVGEPTADVVQTVVDLVDPPPGKPKAPAVPAPAPAVPVPAVQKALGG